MKDNVVEFKVTPKKLKRTYKRHHYVVEYVPATKKWKWTVEVVTTTKYGEEAESQLKAFKAAEKHIDRVLKAQGREAG